MYSVRLAKVESYFNDFSNLSASPIGAHPRSQESFASALGLPVLFISRLERQVVTTTIDQVDRLAQIMRIDGETLLYWNFSADLFLAGAGYFVLT